MTGHDSCPACSSWWRLPLLLAVVLAVILLTQVRGTRENSIKPENASANNDATAPAIESVYLTINFGDGRPLINEAATWHEGMTVADLLNNEPRISFATTGSGASAFLTEINGVANQGAAGRNWMYSVNGEHADRSFAVYELRPHDHVLWTFAGQQ
jgi:hypothetical protein